MPSTDPDKRVAGNLVPDTLLTLIAFGIFFTICRSHVMSDNPATVNFWGAFTASCMTGVFWLALHMFKVTLRAQRDTPRRDGK